MTRTCPECGLSLQGRDNESVTCSDCLLGINEEQYKDKEPMNTTKPTKPTRLQKIEALLALRKSWTIEDFKEAYSDDFDWKPNRPQTVSDWRQYMNETMLNTYDDALIDDILDNEVFESAVNQPNNL